MLLFRVTTVDNTKIKIKTLNHRMIDWQNWLNGEVFSRSSVCEFLTNRGAVQREIASKLFSDTEEKKVRVWRISGRLGAEWVFMYVCGFTICIPFDNHEPHFSCHFNKSSFNFSSLPNILDQSENTCYAQQRPSILSYSHMPERCCVPIQYLQLLR